MTWLTRANTNDTRNTMWKIRAEEEKEGFGNSSYKGRAVCFPPAVLLTVMTQSPGRPLSRTRLHTSNLPWHRATETKGELRKASLHGFTLVCQNTGLFREYTSPGGSRFKRQKERKNRRMSRERKVKDGRAPDPELRPLSASVYINLSLLLSETEQKMLWREDKSRRCSSERLRSHPSDLTVIDKQVCRFSEGPCDNRGLRGSAATSRVSLALCFNKACCMELKALGFRRWL